MRNSQPILQETVPTAAEQVRRGARQCVGAGSMVALLLVLTVLPGAAAFAAPEAVGHISVLLQEAVRSRTDREARDTRVSTVEREVKLASSPAPTGGMAVPRGCSLEHRVSHGRVLEHRARGECFTAMPWSSDTPPPVC